MTTNASSHRYTYLGPSGTFSEQALLSLHAGAGECAWPAPTVNAALDRVRESEAERAIVPFENSVEGAVSATLDELIHGEPLQIVAEAHIEVQFILWARPGTTLADVETVATHPHAAAQTRGWVAQHLADAHFTPESSTARAAARVAAGDYDAAIASPLAGQRHGLIPLAERLDDRPGAITRFVEVALPGSTPPATGADTTTVVASIKQNRPGALLELLEQFAVRGVDLSRLESRPVGNTLGEYCFTIDLAGHVTEPRVTEALAGLWRTCADVRFLGSYARADGRPHTVDPEAGEQAYRDASEWIQTHFPRA